MRQARHWKSLLLACHFTALCSWPVDFAQAGDKTGYSLINPTPDNLLRDLTTDRPDLTESPQTVDAGRVQVEINALGFSRSRADSDGAVTDSFEYATTNIRVGLTHNTEFNIVLRPYGSVRTRPGQIGTSSHQQGIGGIDIRAKLNLFGNDAFEHAGDTALAILPFITLPTDRNNGISPDALEGGLIIPFGVVLPNGFGLGINAGATAVKDDVGSGYHAEFLASLVLSYQWSENLGTYYEIATTLGTDDPRGDILILGTGFTYAVSGNMQLDAGVNFGVSAASDRINPFLGLTRRF